MFGKLKKKNRLGFNPKLRTKEEIDRDYTQNAIDLGHKARLVSKFQEEIERHVERLKEINAEGMRYAESELRRTQTAQPIVAEPPQPSLEQAPVGSA